MKINDQDSWQVICDEISEFIGRRFIATSLLPVHGGDINQAYLLTNNEDSFFVKVNEADKLPMFIAEDYGLKVIRETQTIKVPSTFFSKRVDRKAYLVMQSLEFKANGDNKLFAKALAQMHLNTNSKFGWASDNFIGSSLQPNAWSSNWPDFFVSHRLEPQISHLEEKKCPTELVRDVQTIQSNICNFFQSYSPKASLVHGDLWQGNYSFLKSGKPVIYDPAAYYGDHEVDLAMLELFGNPGQAFFRAYQEIYPIAEDYPRRRALYNLYHILNHANLFGGGYMSQAQRIAEQLVSTIH